MIDDVVLGTRSKPSRHGPDLDKLATLQILMATGKFAGNWIFNFCQENCSKVHHFNYILHKCPGSSVKRRVLTQDATTGR